MIAIKYDGRLGNKMFMYGIAYALSKKHKLKINAKKPEYPCKSNLEIEEKRFKNKIIVKNENVIEIFEADKIESNLILNDFFQTEEIVTKFKEYFKECFELNENSIDGTLIHYRLGDLLEFYGDKAIPSLAYYEKCLENINNKENIKITTDSPEHENIKYLIKKYKAQLINLNPAESIKYGSRFKNKILSLGTFSWWIGTLGKENCNVYCPILSEYFQWMGKIYCDKNWNYISNKNE